jgi:hypothetical protein
MKDIECPSAQRQLTSPLALVGEHMSRPLGQRIVVENIVGAGAAKSIRTMRATPDGYTIETGWLETG